LRQRLQPATRHHLEYRELMGIVPSQFDSGIPGHPLLVAPPLGRAGGSEFRFRVLKQFLPRFVDEGHTLQRVARLIPEEDLSDAAQSL
jgi:hypothetical protein